MAEQIRRLATTASAQDRVAELEGHLMDIRRKLLSVPEMDRHYAYRMRVNVDEVVDGIGSVLVRN